MYTAKSIKSVLLAALVFITLGLVSAVAGQYLYRMLNEQETQVAYWPRAVEAPKPAHRI